MTPEEFKRLLLEGMHYCAEHASEFYYTESKSTLLGFLERCPKDFTPTQEDKRIFRKVINENFEALWQEYETNTTERANTIAIGARLMSHYYYPGYQNIPWKIIPNKTQKKPKVE